MSKQAILDQLNELIEEEHGKPVTINSMFMDSELDSLGVMLVILGLETDYPIFKDLPDDAEDAIKWLDPANLTVRDLVQKCRSSITNSSTEQKPEEAT